MNKNERGTITEDGGVICPKCKSKMNCIGSCEYICNCGHKLKAK